MPLQLPGIEAEQDITAVVIADVTEARERIEAARNRNILLSMAGLLVVALLVMAGTHSPLARLRRVASLLPLLAEHQFGTVRRNLEAIPPMLLPDELSQLERTTLALADRLEALEGEVRDRNRALASKMRELSIERERYELAAAGANDGLWDWDLQRDEVYYSQRWRAMVGCAGSDLWNGPDEWLERVHPDDRESLERDLKTHLEGRSHWFESEHRVLNERDEYRWMLVRGLAVRGADGTAHRIAGSMTDVTEQRRNQEQLRHDALHDALTGLPNRTLFLDRLEQAMLRAQRSRFRFAVLFLDIDDFKTINDSLGHAHGDQVLLQAAGRLRDPLRPGDTVARLGGDEFAILLEGLTTDAEIEQVVERLQSVMATPVTIGAQAVFIRFSIGIATSTTPGQNPADILRNADTAMYQSKAGNRGGSTFFDESMHAHAVRRLSLETSMRQALDNGEFELHFQPLVRLADGRLGGFEALARWPRGQQRPVSPADFVPLAEQSGLIIPLGRWVIEEAVAQAARWYHQRGGSEGVLLPVSLNVSGRQLRDPELLPTLVRALQTHDLPGRGIKLELTESAIIENISHSREVLRSLRELGVSLCIDDFGTGYSSLSQLRDFPFDVLKIDRSLITQLTEDPSQEAIVRAIVSIASALGKSVVAEGIETRAQALRLVALKCEMGQGFLFAPALPPDEALALFDDEG
jgi:diguanylate cyclase (GGDEF)-like protein/PAS domain S-box-containing protein